MHWLAPSFILEKRASGELSGHFAGAGLFVDISGFTPITNTLLEHGQYGAEILANVMRTVFTPLVHAVQAQGGMVCYFAGDAFTSVFPAESAETVGASRRALAAAWHMQEHMATCFRQVTEYGTFHFSAKIGLAAGRISWGILESAAARRATYYFRGSGIDGAVAAEEYAQPGNIIVTDDIYRAVEPFAGGSPVSGYWRIIEVRPGTPAPQLVERRPVDVAEMSRFFSHEVVNQTLPGEFRQVVNVFVNLQGEPDHEQLNELMAAAFDLQSRYGGLLSHVGFGDKGCHFLYFWGAPTSYENDLQRALSFILDLREACRIPLRAAVTYSLAHAGFVGSELAEVYTCYGSGVNLAARYAMAAEYGDIWLDAESASRVRGAFATEHLGSYRLKGFAEEQSVYRLLQRLSRAPVHFYQRPLVGRHEELAQMKVLLRPIFSGSFAGIVSITGEPGIGKSHLLHALESGLVLEQGGLRWILCQSDEILRQSLNPFRYFLHRYFEQSPTDVTARNRARFERIYDALLADIESPGLQYDLQRARPYLAALLDMHQDHTAREQIEPQLRFANRLNALKSLLKAESLRQPVVIQLEDAQWLDDDSRQFLRVLTRNVSGFPFAVLVTSRVPLPEDELDSDVPHTRIVLDALDEQEITRLGELLLERPLPVNVNRLLLQRTEGNPFFAEQLLLHLRQRDTLEKIDLRQIVLQPEAYLPADVRALLTARLDRLPSAVKEVVQQAAVLGREFEIPVLRRMAGHDELRQKLDVAVREQVCYPLDELRHVFKHALLRDAAYNMQLHSRLRLLHRRAAEILEEVGGAARSRHAEIAYHFDQAGVAEQACSYYRRAGEEAVGNYRNDEALTYFTRALELAPEDDVELRYALLACREAVHGWLGRREQQTQDLAAMAALVDSVVTEKRIELALRRADYLLAIGEYELAVEEAKEAAQQARATDDEPAEARAQHRWGRILWQAGHSKEAGEHVAQALRLARQTEDAREEAEARYDLAVIHNYHGEQAAAAEQARQAMGIYQSLNDKQGEIRCLNLFGLVSYAQGDFPAAQAQYQQGLALCREVGWRQAESVLLSNLGNNHFELGDYLEAAHYQEQALAVSRELGSREREAICLDTLGLVYHCLGRPADAQDYFQKALAVNEAVGNMRSQAFILTHFGYTLNELDAPERATELLQQALSIRENLDTKPLMVDTLAGLALAARQQGLAEEAEAYAQRMAELLQEHGTDGVELPVLVYLIGYRVLADGDPPAALDMLQAGVELIWQRAAHIQDLSLRQQFLEAVPYNRQLLQLWSDREG